jgi:hypothetical protein
MLQVLCGINVILMDVLGTFGINVIQCGCRYGMALMRYCVDVLGIV